MRERLIELVKPFVSGFACDQESGICELTDCRTCNARVLADHLLANGVIVPPVFVGQMVYHYCPDLGGVFPYFVETVNVGYLGKERNYWTYEANCHDEETDEFLDGIDFDLDDFGKTVFLNREEAEQALEKMKGGE